MRSCCFSAWRSSASVMRRSSSAVVIFRTAAEDSILPGRVSSALLDQWHYDAEASARLGADDRSAIYGGFHIYRKKA